jgi:hypothetical protein
LSNQERYPVDWQRLVGERPPAEFSILEGILAEREGDWQAALILLREALVVAPQPYDNPFWVHYYQALQHSPDAVDQGVAGKVLKVLSSHDYQEIHVAVGGQGLTAPAHELEVNSTSQGCAEVARFGYDENALERGPLVPVSLVWQCESTRTVTRTILALNLVPNAGFEWNRETYDEYPLGHERSFYHHDGLAYRSVGAEQRGGSLEGVAWIRQPPPANEASFVPAPIRVSPGSCYLHAAWGKSPNGPGQLAIRWRNGAGSWLQGDYLSTAAGDQWVAAAHVVRSPGDAVFADAIVGYQGTGVPHFFDNHLLIPLPDAPCGQEQTH